MKGLEPRFRYVYQCSPIDWFDDAQSLGNMISADLLELDGLEYGFEHVRNELVRRLALVDDCQEALSTLRVAPRAHWDGDIIQGGPHAVLVPDPAEFRWTVVAWVVKQVNNGTTFVVSRIAMPWLEGHSDVIDLEPTT
jgi:hypothetical protein